VFDHVTIRVADLAASRRFYERLFGRGPDVPEICEWGDFSIAAADRDRPAARRLGMVLGVPGSEPARASDPDGNAVEIVPGAGMVTIERLRLRTRDLAAARRFYETIAPVVGEAGIDLLDAEPPTEHVHLAFGVANNAAVDEFHRVALAAAYPDNGGPGERPEYHPGYYGAFVLDPDGHNVEAVCHNRD
jgi:catechol 2,3-dioxygenase-like lactoylglutathione lyase family enzyme